MLSISLGPLALPIAPLLLLLAVWAASLLASRLARRQSTAPAPGVDAARHHHHGAAAGQAVINAALLGLLVARLTHLALHAQAYFVTPWAAFDVRDGGWNLPAGALAGAGWLSWQALRAPALRRALAAATLAGAAFWLMASWSVGRFDTSDMPALVAQDFSSGSPISLREAARGRPAVVNLWASWCGPCRQEMPLLAAAQQRETGVAFLFVNQGESAGAVRAYLAEQGLPLREVILDTTSSLGKAVGSRGLPTTLFYDTRGRQVEAHFGVLNAAALAGKLSSLRPDGHGAVPSNTQQPGRKP